MNFACFRCDVTAVGLLSIARLEFRFRVSQASGSRMNCVILQAQVVELPQEGAEVVQGRIAFASTRILNASQLLKPFVQMKETFHWR